MKLTESQAERQQKARAVPGMAHFAGSGPAGAKCEGCKQFEPQMRMIADMKTKTGQGRCRLATRLLGNRTPLIGENMDACKFHEKPE